MAIPDRSKLHGTEFATYENDLPMPKKHKAKDIVPKEKPAKAPKKHFKEKLAESGVSEFTCIDWVEYFMYKCNAHGYRYFRGQKGNIINENKIISQMMKDFEPEQIKTIMDFMWDIWDNPKIDKRTMKISILNTGWTQEIINLAEAWSKGESCSAKPKVATPPQREWRQPTPEPVATEEKPKKQSRIII